MRVGALRRLSAKELMLLNCAGEDSQESPGHKDITLPTKVHIVKAMVFPVVMYECGSWKIKKAEH